MSNKQVNQSSNTTPAIIVMFALFFMIAFVTNLAGSMGVVVTGQFGASKALSQLGTLANFIAYACMGIPAGIILKRKGYKFTALAAVIVGLVGVAVQWISGPAESFLVYVIGAFIPVDEELRVFIIYKELIGLSIPSFFSGIFDSI